MLTLREKNGDFTYPLLLHPLPRVLKFEYLKKYLKDLQYGESVVDYGSGDRPYERLLLKKFSRYIAADYQVTNSKHSKEPDIYICGEHLDVAANSVSCVVLTEVLEHIYQPEKVLRELHRILQPGGRLIGTVPFVVSEHEEPYDYHRFTFYCLERMFQDEQFEIVSLEYVGDNIGVCLSVIARILVIPVKALSRSGLPTISYLLNAVLKVPEFIYMWLRRAGFDPQRIPYFQQLPLGFAFCLEKPKSNSTARPTA
jgi:SAM-dependent methyltransferase